MVIDSIRNLSAEDSRKILNEFLGVYFDKGFGIMNKTEIETLLYYVLRNNGLLTGKCFDDSFSLQITEAKARRLIYESQIKYDKRDKNEHLLYLRKSVGECLRRAYISQNNKTIKFAIEDKYLRVALNAQLREYDFFADTSFNTDIVSLDINAFTRLVTILVPNYEVDQVLEKLQDESLSEETKQKSGGEFWRSIIKDIMVAASVEGLKKIGEFMLMV